MLLLKEILEKGDQPLVSRLLIKSAMIGRLDAAVNKLYPNQVMVRINNADSFVAIARKCLGLIDTSLDRKEMRALKAEVQNSLVFNELKERIKPSSIGCS